VNVIETLSLFKAYGQQPVLHDISLSVGQGRLAGFLGPNGAGKTTAIRILVGLLTADRGQAQVFGQPCWKAGKSIRQRIGYLPGDVHFYANLKGRTTLEFLAGARKLDCRSEMDRLAGRLALPLDQTVRTYSTGMKQKLGLIQALMHRPELLILDEPTSGLDPLVRNEVFSELRDVIQQGRTVLFSSHSLDEVDQLCDEVIILKQGRIVEHQEIETLRARALRRVAISFRTAVNIEKPDGFQVEQESATSLTGTWKGEVNELLNWLRPYQLDDLIVERPDLNDLFMTYYSDH
jgi:ABC-2 type transport system ATP-binding protein